VGKISFHTILSDVYPRGVDRYQKQENEYALMLVLIPFPRYAE